MPVFYFKKAWKIKIIIYSYKNLFKIFILLFFIIFGVSANTGPDEVVSVDTAPKSQDKLLSQNVSVEREDLTFDFSSDANAYKPNIKETFDAKKVFEKWKSKFFVDQDGDDINYSFTSKKNYFHFSFGLLHKNDVWYPNKEKGYRSQNYDDNLVKITAKYYLKNQSNNEFNNEQLYFSPFWDSFWPWWDNTAIEAQNHYYIVLNNLTGNIIISLSWEKLDIKSKYEINRSKFWDEWEFKLITIKPIYLFNISLKPNEQKILQIEYYIPKWYYLVHDIGNDYYSYDFAPVFEWKWNKLPLLNLKFIYDKWNRFSYAMWRLYSNISKFFDKLSLTSDDKKNIYQAEYTNLKKWDIEQFIFTDYKEARNVYISDGNRL